MRRYVFGFAMLAIASCLPVAARADQQQDKKIAETTIQRLDAEKKAGRLKGFSIDLQVEDGTLWLSGRVTSKEQQTAALDVARRVPGVKQVVNDITVATPPAPKAQTTLVATTVGSGVTPAAATSPVTAPVQTMQQPMASQADPALQGYAPQGYVPQGYVPQGYAPQGYGHGQRPVAFSPAYSVAMANANFPGHHFHRHGGYAGGYGGADCPPGAMGGAAMGGAPAARYDSPQMPAYAWPSYAAHPNYAAVQYPKQYAASAWPYIGPFYPYPQVPLGWRKVCLEWDDGWWFLDFKDCHHDR